MSQLLPHQHKFIDLLKILFIPHHQTLGKKMWQQVKGNLFFLACLLEYVMYQRIPSGPEG